MSQEGLSPSRKQDREEPQETSKNNLDRLETVPIPKKVFIRIKDEKRRFNNALKKEIEKE